MLLGYQIIHQLIKYQIDVCIRRGENWMWWQTTDETSMSPSEMVLYLER